MWRYVEFIMIRVLLRVFRPNGPRYHSPGRSPGYAAVTTSGAPTGRAIRSSAARWAFRFGFAHLSQGCALGYDSAALRAYSHPRPLSGHRPKVGRERGPRRDGVVLVLVLIVIALLTLAGFTFSELMLTERKAARLSARQAQARALANSGLEMTRLFATDEEEVQKQAGGLYDNQERFRGVLVIEDEDARRRGRFAVVAPAMDDDGRLAGMRFGLEDVSGRLNLSVLLSADALAQSLPDDTDEEQPLEAKSAKSANDDEDEEEEEAESGGRAILLKLPGMTEQIADAILDWIDEDDEPREYGAELDYYATLDPPYSPRNGPLETIEELLLVRGVTPWLLFGPDANRNGRIDPGEPAEVAIENVDNSDGTMNRGWAAYLTLNSLELNVRPDGTPKIDLNQEDMQQLHQELEAVLDGYRANFIVAYRQNGPYSGSKPGDGSASGRLDLSKKGKTPLTTVLDLIGTRVQVKFEGDEKESIIESPFPNMPGMMGGYMSDLMDNVTVNPSPIIPGRININQASRTVLSGIPGISEETVDEIISERQPDPLEADPERRHETWILAEGIVTLEEMKELMPFVTGGGNVFQAQFIGYFDSGGPPVRIEATIDATTRPARVISWRDISHLGRGYALETLGVER